ncbi:hypothetical protein [Leptospira sp. GIMC2001]|uniref:hypothetical protein n=1 Tax=Leptospira sp. GIMC2001 TaxID=1513297 RepID=UPI00234A1661|nr:hypothetical protein [Leptospira sp. GIMC2001]WCL48659.1 hypothetical protein O4O04_15300 [Leptospira sp. GIMC2001]
MFDYFTSSGRFQDDETASKFFKLMNIKTVITTAIISIYILLIIGCGGINGNDTVDLKDFKDDRDNALQLTIIRCLRIEPEKEDTSVNILIFLPTALGNSTQELDKSIGYKYITSKDRDYCINSILTIPCDENLFLSIIIVLDQLCQPKRASIWQNQHFGEGEMEFS